MNLRRNLYFKINNYQKMNNYKTQSILESIQTNNNKKDFNLINSKDIKFADLLFIIIYG